MKRLFLLMVTAGMTYSLMVAQDNTESLRHLAVGAEIGLHGLGVELAMPLQKHLVLKAGYNWAPAGDLYNTDISIDTEELKSAQEQYELLNPTDPFEHKFGDEAIINAGVRMGLSNLKAMINWYPFSSGGLYMAGGVYYTPSSKKDDAFIRLSGSTTENDWAALQELRSKTGDDEYEIALSIGDEKYPVIEKDGCGYMEAAYRIDPLKYYLGLGLGRSFSDKPLSLQFEVGAMIYHNSLLYCQDKEVGSIMDAAEGLGNDAKEILEYVDKYPIYPQVTLRLNFRLF